MGALVGSPKEIEKAKRFKFIGFEGAGILSAIFISGWIALPLMAVGIYYGLDWFNFRAKNGMKF